MFKDIDTIDPQSGRILKEDNSVVNMADTIAGALDPLEGFAVYNEMQHSIHKGEAFGYSANGTLTNGATITGGTIIFDSKPPLVSGQGNSVNSAKSSIEDGWILKQNTDYSIRITNQSGASVIYNTSFGWHESSIILS